ncbi:cytochrome c3 family protein [Thermodesulfobacteriota bacterium]
MFNGKNLIHRMGLIVALIACLFLLGHPGPAQTEDEVPDYVEKARFDAEKARAEAEKAMAEAERAMVEAEMAMERAERARQEAKHEKAKAIEKMVEAHRYPDDIDMTVPDSGTTAVFSHKKHTDREHLKCIECHPKVFIMKVGKNVVKKGQLTMAEMKKGKYCGNCHNGHKAFSVNDIASCKRCHPKS